MKLQDLKLLLIPIVLCSAPAVGAGDTGEVPPAAPQKRIYIANDGHTDYMWTADADTYADV